MEYNKLIELRGSAIKFGADLQTDSCCIISGVEKGPFISRSNKVTVTVGSHEERLTGHSGSQCRRHNTSIKHVQYIFTTSSLTGSHLLF